MTLGLKRLLIRLLGVLLCAAVAVRAVVWAVSQPPAGLGITDNQLAACSDRPNCVSSFSQTDRHRIAPLPFQGSTDHLIENLKSIVNGLPRTRVVRQTSRYLHIEFRSFWFGFIDDVEFLVDASQKRVQFRSASRMGYSDLGVNRQRMEMIRQLCDGNL